MTNTPTHRNNGRIEQAQALIQNAKSRHAYACSNPGNLMAPVYEDFLVDEIAKATAQPVTEGLRSEVEQLINACAQLDAEYPTKEIVKGMIYWRDRLKDFLTAAPTTPPSENNESK